MFAPECKRNERKQKCHWLITDTMNNFRKSIFHRWAHRPHCECSMKLSKQHFSRADHSVRSAPNSFIHLHVTTRYCVCVHDLTTSHGRLIAISCPKISTVFKLDQTNEIGTTNRHQSRIQFATAAIMVSIFLSTISMHTARQNREKREKKNRSLEKYNPQTIRSLYPYFVFSLCSYFLFIFIFFHRLNFVDKVRVAWRWIKIVFYNVRAHKGPQPNNCYVNKWKIHGEFERLCSLYEDNDKYQPNTKLK